MISSASCIRCILAVAAGISAEPKNDRAAGGFEAGCWPLSWVEPDPLADVVGAVPLGSDPSTAGPVGAAGSGFRRASS